MNEFVLIDAAIVHGLPQFDDLTRTPNAIPLYADLPSPNASLLGPWLLDAEAFYACLGADEPLSDEPLGLPWRYGASSLITDATLAALVFHFESQRSIGMADGDRYYLRYADTRALDALARVLTPQQVSQLKGPVVHWRYVDRFEERREFGAGVPANARRHDAIVLSDAQSAQLLEQQLAGALADAVYAGSGGRLNPHLVASQYRHIEASAAFVLRHGIEPFEVQRHVASVAIETGGALLTDERFLTQVESLRSSRRWRELMAWRAASKT
jgi:Domain of unknown function (DUF4123)